MNLILYITVILLIGLGLFALMFKKNLIKLAIALNVIEAGVNLFLISLAYIPDSNDPIFTLAPELENLSMVLPTTHALILTNIVIGIATTALMMTFAIITFRNNKTIDIRKLKGIEEND